jgi:hypothetical protein
MNLKIFISSNIIKLRRKLIDVETIFYQSFVSILPIQ